MEIVIDIPEEDLDAIEELKSKGWASRHELRILQGKPLPKGHGDLVDISSYKGKVICSRLYSGVKKLIEVDSIEPIIEASSEEG